MKANYLALAIGCLGVCAPAAAEEVTVAMGIRAWQNTWRGNGLASDAAGNVIRPYQIIVGESAKETTGIPFALVRYGDFGVSASAFLSTAYTNPLDGASATRREADVNALYFFLPSTSVSVGYKQLRFGNVKMGGVTAALSASAPLGNQWGLYGAFAVGRLKTDVGSTISGLRTTYTSLETGLTYSLGAFVGKSSAVTLGYRAQKFKISDYPIFETTRNLTDLTQGPVIGYVVQF